jgi:hypothetical protein
MKSMGPNDAHPLGDFPDAVVHLAEHQLVPDEPFE